MVASRGLFGELGVEGMGVRGPATGSRVQWSCCCKALSDKAFMYTVWG